MSSAPPRSPRHLRDRRREARERVLAQRRRRRSILAWVALLAVFAIVAFAVSRIDLTGGGDDELAVQGETPASAGPPPESLTFPEGLRREEVAERLAEETDLSGERYLELTGRGSRGRELAGTDGPTSLEGFLFPATFQIGSRTTVQDLVDAQLAAYQVQVGGIDYGYARRRNLTRYEVLIIASLVEREVKVPEERALVAGVIYNRLRRGMRLDIDATVQYALGFWKPTLTASDLENGSPYNTRRFDGLPPGPICNPGRASIEAAARPRESDFIYYVARNDPNSPGRHYFARTPEGFEAAVARSRANARG